MFAHAAARCSGAEFAGEKEIAGILAVIAVAFGQQKDPCRPAALSVTNRRPAVMASEASHAECRIDFPE
ncbi:hypothetical protein [Nonomuraea rubra]|uniref:Uncharacterized protein n=1 Tax=Nonomuraea rubra TaxID=46180 RepID=A0A7X0TWJ2_9ACTN|nr:hypothetical protein [Nonomuraea rubra]MBB6546239.1 hypothetical protein [Nonomuraea rubra]